MLASALKYALLVVGLSVSCAACVQRPKRVTSDSIANIVSRTAPKPAHALDIRFETKVRLIGYDVSPEKLVPGGTFTVTWYWQVDEPLKKWKLFTHLSDASNKQRMNADGVRALPSVYPEPEWKKGDFIKDAQEITLPNDWDADNATFYLGFWKGEQRLHVTSGPSDGHDRAKALTLPVDPSAAAQVKKPTDTLPRLVARRVAKPPVLDGKLDDADWNSAQSSGPLVQTMTGMPGAFGASARVLYDADYLYVGYDVGDDYLKCTFSKNDDHLWEQDAVELMVDPDGDGKNYFEMQASPTALTFDTRYDSRRQPQPFGDMAWSSAATAKVALHGKPNDDEADEGYSVELAIPWRAFAAGPTPAKPPLAGEMWRMNFFVMDARPKGQRAVGWAPPMVGDFHTLNRFGRVVFPQAALPQP
jgi:hypothetical protein